MNITCNVTDGMTPQEKDVFFKHMEKRHAEEHEYVEARRLEAKRYRDKLIESILKHSRGIYTRTYLQKKTTRVLEIMDMY